MKIFLVNSVKYSTKEQTLKVKEENEDSTKEDFLLMQRIPFAET